MAQQALYESIDLNKPWNDPANAAAFSVVVPEYQCPSLPCDSDNRTTYQAVVTPDNCFRATEPRDLSDITDGAGQTLMLIEVDEEHAVPWMSPVDADEEIVLALGGPNSRTAHPGMQSVFADSSVKFLPSEMPANLRQTLISVAGNEKGVDRIHGVTIIEPLDP